MRLTGWATAEGTMRYRDRASGRDDFYSQGPSGLVLSSLGIGTYQGTADADGDRRYAEALRHALRHGIDVVDTAIKYRDTRSERTIGAVIRELVDEGALRRDEIFVSTKGGLVPKSLVTDRDHCIEPAFLAEQLERSREHLGLDTIDCYFIHNPEQELQRSSREDFYVTLRAIFDMLEQRVAAGHIRAYGLASWKGFRVPATSVHAIDLDRVHRIACDVTSTPHLRFIELPLSVGMPVSHTFATIRRATELGLGVFTSASLYEGKLVQLANLIQVARHAHLHDTSWEPESVSVSLPQSGTSLVQLFELLDRAKTRGVDLPELLRETSPAVEGLYPRALDAVRSFPGVTTALFGGDDLAYVADNLSLANVPRCAPDARDRLWSLLG